MTQTKRRLLLFNAALIGTFVCLRVFLHQRPDTDLNIGRYNIHHLFTGLLLVMLGGIPLALLRGRERLRDFSLLVFGAGLSMALDEWVYLIATDGTNASYLLPVSFRGGVVMVGLACLYSLLVGLLGKGDDERA